MRHLSKLFRNGQKIFIRNYKAATFLPQQQLNEQNQTLLTRIACYIDSEYNKNEKFKCFEQLKNINAKKSMTDCIEYFTDDELQGLLSNLKERKSFSKQGEFSNIMNVIDRECISRLDYLDSGAVLNILNALTQVGVESLTKYKFYEFAINNLVENIQFLNRQELLQMMFYVGLKKKNKEAQGILKKCMRELHKYDINQISIEELCIICNSTFKTSTKITSKKIMDKIHHALNDNLCVLHDPALFVTLIKTIRHNRDQNDDILSTIACTILFNKTYEVYSFTAMCHILALFADASYYDKGLLCLFVSSCLNEINVLSNKVYLIRNKDLTRFLWSLSALNFCEDTTFLNTIVPIIERKVQMGSYQNDIEELVEVILYLWMLNYQAIGLINYALTPENISYIKDQKSRTKLRLNLLISCIYFENRQTFKDLNLSNEPFHPLHTKLQLERRPCLVRVLEILKRLSRHLPVNKFEITHEVPHLDICGITGYRNRIYKAIYVEVLDDNVCVKNREVWPIGPMFLKLRILKSFDEALIIIDEDMVKNFTEEELEDYLIHEIQLLC